MRTSFHTVFNRDLKKLKDSDVLKRVQAVIEEVEAAATLAVITDLKKLSGTDNCYRIRVGSYRIGVIVEGDVVEFARCLPRRDLYRYFP